jgi:carbonic anhydrase
MAGWPCHRQACQHLAMFDELLAANRRFAEGFAWGDLTAPARRHLAVVTCMDTRIDPLAVLGLSVGDAKIVRNAGGRVTTDVLRSLVLASVFLSVTHVVVMHHTGCALAGQDDEQVRSAIPAAQRGEVTEAPLLAMPDPDAALAADVDAVRSCASLPAGMAVEGWRYDVATGLVARCIPS